MAWVHASSSSGRKSERWPTAPFASNVKGFPCKSLDAYEPPNFCQRSPYIFPCTGDPPGIATRKSSKKSWPHLMLHTVNCWLVPLLAWIGHVLGTKSCTAGTCEFQFLWSIWFETLVTHMLRTTLETWSLCGEFTLWQMVTSPVALRPVVHATARFNQRLFRRLAM